MNPLADKWMIMVRFDNDNPNRLIPDYNADIHSIRLFDTWIKARDYALENYGVAKSYILPFIEPNPTITALTVHIRRHE